MSSVAKLLSASGGVDKLYVDDVFSAYTYTGNGSTQTINNGIDLAGKGGLVWLKQRTGANGHNLYDSAQGATNKLATNETNPISGVPTGLTAFSSSGFSLGAFAETNLNASSFVSWAFRKAPKFFDVRVISGTGSQQVIPHSLGVTPGMVIIRQSNTTANWFVWHRSLSSPFTKTLYLQTTDAEISNPNVIAVSATSITSNGFPAGSNNLIAYFFAHDTSADGIIQCGSFTTDGSGNATVNLGWEPQYLLQKSSSAAGNWIVQDSMRGLTVGTSDAFLYPNLSSAEGTNNYITPTATGFTVANMSASETSIYLAIRRPNKPPTSGTQVYNAIARTGTGAAATVTGVGFAPDLVMSACRSFGTGHAMSDRLRGANRIVYSPYTYVEYLAPSSVNVFDMDGVSLGADTGVGIFNMSGYTYINHFFKRAPGVFDIVCYTGTGVAHTESHNLGVVPELAIFKGRTVSGDWFVNIQALSTIYATVFLNTSAATSNNSLYTSTPTASAFTFTGTNVNNNTQTYVAYLFATKAGISKVGSYTGNGTSQTINCGFTTGARFILIKRTDSTGDWYVWDTVRGIIAGNDPHLSLNTTVAEVTSDDSIDPASSGFIVNQLAATNINVTSASYVFLAIA